MTFERLCRFPGAFEAEPLKLYAKLETWNEGCLVFFPAEVTEKGFILLVLLTYLNFYASIG